MTINIINKVSGGYIVSGTLMDNNMNLVKAYGQENVTKDEADRLKAIGMKGDGVNYFFGSVTKAGETVEVKTYDVPDDVASQVISLVSPYKVDKAETTRRTRRTLDQVSQDIQAELERGEITRNKRGGLVHADGTALTKTELGSVDFDWSTLVYVDPTK